MSLVTKWLLLIKYVLVIFQWLLPMKYVLCDQFHNKLQEICHYEPSSITFTNITNLYNSCVCTFLRWKIAMNVSDSLFVSSASGNSLKYCFTISATSYACWPSKLVVSPCISVISFSFWIRDRTPDLRNKPTWSSELTRNQRNAAWIHFGKAWPFLCKDSSNGTPNTVLSGTQGNRKVFFVKTVAMAPQIQVIDKLRLNMMYLHI